ncbi:YEATS domain containing 2 homolog D12 [Musca autumnalis]|uniref:YEATS domain containing 2 homolog D12 n=1 Tax=Musca autumnalis TaxID=221902 RepID=UPI003CEB423B
MFSSGQSSPRKRKHSEFHDPDYPQALQTTCDDESTDPESTTAKRQKQVTLEGCAVKSRDECMEKVRQIIDREFNTELAFKQKQLLEIDQRLEQARTIFDKLRYALVSDYYKKQDLPVAAVTTSAVRSAQPLFSREDRGPQMQIHPSLKKLIGKKPKDLADVIRSCPKRAAAQNAVQTIRAKSDVQKREERKLKQIIRGQGIVIDHSTNDDKRTDIAALLNAAQLTRNISSKHIQNAKSTKCVSQGKALNSARLNNKEKHLFVVGNTSKFIGSEPEDARDKSKILTHKWLVYVQMKNSSVPIEKYVKKIRFHLHHSYRPNDVVDVFSPPYHVARRGWGEFPIRVQLFFHDEYNQKPIQLLHTVVLDKTLSGIQTLGAETLLEVWLRNICPTDSVSKNQPSIPQLDVKNNEENEKPCQVPSTEELVDDNLLEFLNKIEASQNSISADIEKIQPTFVISQSNACKSPDKAKSPNKAGSPKKADSKASLEKHIDVSQPVVNIPETIEVISNQPPSKDDVTSDLKSKQLVPRKIESKFQTPNEISLTKTPSLQQQNISLTPNISNPISIGKNASMTQNRNSLPLNKDGKLIMPINSVASVVRRTILPVTSVARSMSNIYSTPASTARSTSIQAKSPVLPAKQILQKKLVQLVDSSGNVKYMQMLVATSSTAPSTKTHDSLPSMAPKLLTVSNSCGQTSSVTSTTVATKNNPVPTMKPNIFKIVPEHMQTKPQIVTFSTKTTTATTTTMTSTLSNTNLNKQIQTIAQKQHISSSKIVSKPNGGSTTKNVVFHKEGKLYIIDPLQMKLKQQQKKQVSLLKPQVSLLKQQFKPQQQKETSIEKMTSTKSASDHDYLPPQKTAVQTNSPPVHYGLKQQRQNTLNIFQLLQMKRVLFEKHVLRQQFSNMQNAVEFILRRLKLIAPKNSLVSAFPFVSNSNGEFQSLTAFKQRSYEWLRAKHISILMRNHKDLRNINSTNRETFWTTKEIATFARQYAYTPDIKSLPKLNELTEHHTNDFKELVKGELKHKETTPCDTLSDCRTIINWIEKVWPVLINYQHTEDENHIIDVDSTREEQDRIPTNNLQAPNTELNVNLSSKRIYFPPPSNLQNECDLVTGICKDFSIELEPEEISPNKWYPSVQIVLAHSLNIFLQKIIRGAISLKHHESSAISDSLHVIQPTDIAKLLSNSREFDFLTNSNFGRSTKVDLSAVKQEKL